MADASLEEGAAQKVETEVEDVKAPEQQGEKKSTCWAIVTLALSLPGLVGT